MQSPDTAAVDATQTPAPASADAPAEPHLAVTVVPQRTWPPVVPSCSHAAWLAFVAKHGPDLRRRYPGNSDDQLAVILQHRFEALPPGNRAEYENSAYSEAVRAVFLPAFCRRSLTPVGTQTSNPGFNAAAMGLQNGS
jgi:hypothetical protein